MVVKIRLCSVTDCRDQVWAKEWCTFHYDRQWRGMPMDAPQRRRRGTGSLTADGYVDLRVDGRQQGEHRWVMEAQIGRRLLPGENVHHINGVRNDNRPENLELWVTFQPSGQRPADLVAWAHEILARYEKEI